MFSHQLRQFHWTALLNMCVLLWVQPQSCIFADDEREAASIADKSTSGKTIATQSTSTESELEEKESSALQFVETHHAALADMLRVLKAMKPKEYETAINEITKTRRRLEQLQSRDKTLFEVDLEAWKLQSRIDMMMARAVAREQPLDEPALRSLVKQRHENQVRRLRIEQESVAAREKQLRESLERLQTNESERLDQQVSALIKKIDAKKPKNKNKDK